VVLLERDLPEFGLHRNDRGVVVEIWNESAVMVEFMDANGDTVALLDLDAEDVRYPSTEDDAHPQYPDPLPEDKDVPIASALRPETPRGRR
jgi:hypothetical protein